ncbi:unnamed protein product [Musa banksii]
MWLWVIRLPPLPPYSIRYRSHVRSQLASSLCMFNLQK